MTSHTHALFISQQFVINPRAINWVMQRTSNSIICFLVFPKMQIYTKTGVFIGNRHRLITFFYSSVAKYTAHSKNLWVTLIRLAIIILDSTVGQCIYDYSTCLYRAQMQKPELGPIYLVTLKIFTAIIHLAIVHNSWLLCN